MEEIKEAKNKESNDTNSNIPSSNIPIPNKRDQIPHRPTKISEFLKAKKNANINIDLSSITQKTLSSLIGQKKIQNQEEKKVENNANESNKKLLNSEIKKPENENERKRKYRLRTNDAKLPSNINLLKKLYEKMNKNEKESAQPIFKFEEDENNNNNDKNNIKKKTKHENDNNEIYAHKKTSSQNITNIKETNYSNLDFEVKNYQKSKFNKHLSSNPEFKNLNYPDNKYEINSKFPTISQFQNKYQNQNNNNYNNNKNILSQNIDNISIENEIVNNNYYFKLNTMFIEYSFMENANFQFEKSMEDKSKSILNFNNNPNEILLELFDGHGGENVSCYLQKNFSKVYKRFLFETKNDIVNSFSMSFNQIDEDIKKQPQVENQGSTGTIIHIIRDKNNRLFVFNANVGDSRASLISTKKIIRLSQDHRTDDKEERIRIISEGGLIINGRVNGELMLTRSFGDFDFKQNKKNIKNNIDISRFRKGVICEPFVTQIEIDQSINNQFLFLASDGVWDVISEEEIQQLIKVNNDTKCLSSVIIEKALIKKAWDNLSIFTVKLT